MEVANNIFGMWWLWNLIGPVVIFITYVFFVKGKIFHLPWPRLRGFIVQHPKAMLWIAAPFAIFSGLASAVFLGQLYHIFIY